MTYASDDLAQSAATQFAELLALTVEELLGANLIGVYLIGSLAHGGVSRRYSDLDIAIVVENELTPTDIENIRRVAEDQSETWSRKLSIFWTNKDFVKGRFPPLDKIDFLDNAVTLTEKRPIRPDPVALTEVRKYLAGRPLGTWKDNVRRLVDEATLEPEDHESILRAHLYPARFVYSWQTGKMASNDDAVAFLHSHEGYGLDLQLIDNALECRRRANDADQLFWERHRLPLQVQACQRLTAGTH